ncbi:uncharacterized protein LOC126661580 [Mercurialis annua]|uniref:uncharacterized protein LOC126661580 n=1 Tax=Mercurialis annua TaxID=3986 RepID=UPI002160F75B|nr:uncharacterized protein LOC126661580 [Mercurialis annua]
MKIDLYEQNMLGRKQSMEDESDEYDDADEKVRRFSGIRSEWGFDKLVSLPDFKDESNGYLMNDCCIFCAEILVLESVNKGECLSMVKTPANNKYTWTIHRFSELKSLSTNSEEIAVGGSNWSIIVYLKGESSAKCKNLAIVLKPEDRAAFTHGKKLYAEYQLLGKYQELEGNLIRDSE